MKILFILFLCVSVQAAPPQSSSAKSVEGALKDSVAHAVKKIGIMEPWQKKVLEAEVLVNYRKFIKEFRQNSGNTQVDVDSTALSRYLVLGISKFDQTENKDLKFGYLVLSANGCTKCKEADVAIKQLFRSSLERRGFTAQWVDPSESANLGATTATLSKAAFQEKLSQWMSTLGLRGIVALRSGIAVREVDPGHADEIHVQQELSMMVSPRAENVISSDFSVELLAKEGLALGAEKLFSDALIDVGSKFQAVAQAMPLDQLQDETLIVVKGIKGFEHYTKVKESLTEALSSIGQPEDRRSARGLAAFALKGRGSDAVKSALNGWNSDGLGVKWEVQ